MSKRGQSKKPAPSLWIAEAVRPHHANTFAEEWFRCSLEAGAMDDAFAATGLMQWPDANSFEETPAQARYIAIEKEIYRRMQQCLRSAVMEAFTRAATEVLNREHEAQRNK